MGKTMVKFIVDGKELQADERANLLEVCLQNDIYIPNLCYLPGMDHPPASCRLCFVEIDGERKPVSACRTRPKDGMVVRTDTDQVRRLQRSALRLLFSAHHVECRKCPSNRHCALQFMARFLGIRMRPRRFDHLEKVAKTQYDNPLFDFVPSRCVLCGKCIYVCRQRNGYSLLTFAKRGFDTVIMSYGEMDAEKMPCSGCWACVEICPVSAIFMKDPSREKITVEEGPERPASLG